MGSTCVILCGYNASSPPARSPSHQKVCKRRNHTAASCLVKVVMCAYTYFTTSLTIVESLITYSSTTIFMQCIWSWTLLVSYVGQLCWSAVLIWTGSVHAAMLTCEFLSSLKCWLVRGLQAMWLHHSADGLTPGQSFLHTWAAWNPRMMMMKRSMLTDIFTKGSLGPGNSVCRDMQHD